MIYVIMAVNHLRNQMTYIYGFVSASAFLHIVFQLLEPCQFNVIGTGECETGYEILVFFLLLSCDEKKNYNENTTHKLWVKI